jgi:diadenosine tetraphosphate (Ap4A) HIT family hydrolase
MTDCYTCELTRHRDAGTAPLWDSIWRTAHWDVVHAYNTSLPGWLVLVARRHIEAVAELTEAEAAELGVLQQRVSALLGEVTGCVKTYIVQFAEAKEHPHVHFHIIPRMTDQPEAYRSTNIFGYLGVPDAERVPEADMNTIAWQMRQGLSRF